MSDIVYTTIIIEDSKTELDFLKELLSDFEDIKIIGTTDTVSKGINLITKFKPDVVFLDVQLFDNSGFEVLDEIAKYNIFPHIIFTTSHREFAIEAIRYSAFDYIIKPITSKILEKVIDRLKQKRINITGFNQNKISDLNKLAIPLSNKIRLVDFEQIIFLETVKGKGFTKIYLTDGKAITAYKGIGGFDKELLSKNFEKLNRSYTINTSHIVSIFRDGRIEMKGNNIIEASERTVRELLKKLNIQ